jgi:type III secretion protein L
MSMHEIEAPVAPRLCPAGPIVRQEAFGIWSEAQAALDAAERHRKRMRSWTLSAYQRERQRGKDEGLLAGREEAARLVARTAARANSYLNQLERDLPTLVLEMIENLLGQLDPGDLLARAVRNAVIRLRTDGELRLRVAPEQAAVLRAALADIGDENGASMTKIEIDPTLSAGQCVLWSELGNIELGLEAQIRALRQGLLAGEHADRTPEAAP